MSERPFDIIFVAQLIERKQPMFVVSVMKHLPDKTILIIGDGPERERFLQALCDQGTHYFYVNRLDFELMPSQFAQAKICLFPTLDDSWGIVANEALAAGCPVLTTEYAGCAGDLVIHGENGLILPLVADDWAYRIRAFLNWPYTPYFWPKRCKQSLKDYTPELSAKAIQAAVDKAMEGVRYRDSRRTLDNICLDCQSDQQEKCSHPRKSGTCQGDKRL